MTHSLDDADGLAHFRDRFVRDYTVVAYLDGNSLGARSPSPSSG